MLTPAEQTTTRPADRHAWRIDATVLAVVTVALRLPALLASRALVFDDGVFGASALAMRAGEAPFRDVFSSQGPLFLPLVWLADLVGLRTSDAPRLLAVAAGVLVTVATYSCARHITTRWHAVLAAALVTTSGSVLWVTGPVNADGPALALSVLAVALALRARSQPRVGGAVCVDAVWVGLAAGAAISVKALAMPAVLVAATALLASRRRVADPVVAASVAVCVYLTTALPWGIERVWEQSFSYHRSARRQETYAGAVGKILQTLWDRDVLLVVALALAAGTWVVARVTGDRGRAHPRAGSPFPPEGSGMGATVAVLMVWAGLVVALLVWEPALWRAHVAHLVPPLALLAALSPPPWRVVAVTALVLVPVSAVAHRSILWPSPYRGAPAEVVARLESLPEGALVISDDPGLAWRAGRRPPGELVDTSFQRIDRGEITAASVATAARDAEVCAVVVTSAEHFGRLEGLEGRLATVGYRAEPVGPGSTLFVRSSCDRS